PICEDSSAIGNTCERAMALVQIVCMIGSPSGGTTYPAHTSAATAISTSATPTGTSHQRSRPPGRVVEVRHVTAVGVRRHATAARIRCHTTAVVVCCHATAVAGLG